MKYKAEIFDLLQYLFDTTGFNDHQLHCVIQFSGKVDAQVMAQAFQLLTDAVPALSRVYREAGGNAYWEDQVLPDMKDLFSIAGNEEEFIKFTCSKTDADAGLQIRGCLLQAERDALSVIVNHMVTDGAGMKELVCLLSRIYSAIKENPSYQPDFRIDGSRDYKRILSGLRMKDKLRILFFHSRDNNSSGKDRFPLEDNETAEPFIVTHELPSEKYRGIVSYSKTYGITVNDVILAAYCRVLSSMLGLDGRVLCVPIMIDMRRYLDDKSFDAVTNLSSTEIMRVAVQPGESFRETAAWVAAATKEKKADDFGLNSLVKLQTLFKLCGRKLAFKLLQRSLKNPYICMTNIGIIDPQRLKFEGSDIENAYITGSIKYRPHFQMSLSSFGNRLTFAVNLYGGQGDRLKINDFFELLDRELEALMNGNH